MANRYSVYKTGTDEPICIWGSARECAAAMGVKISSFYSYIALLGRGQKHKGIEIIKHDTIGEEDVLL